MINGLNTSKAVSQTYEATNKQENTKATDKSQAKTKEAAAVLELGKSANDTAATYSKPASTATPATTGAAASTSEGTASTESTEADKTNKLNAEEINRLWAEANRATQNLRDIVEGLLKSQGKAFKDVLSGKEELIVDEETRLAAQQAIAEDGECGVQAVSDRIVDFAKAISNNNPEMYDKLMSAIDEGFAQAEKAFGGTLPDICKKTREEISRKMEEWKSGKAESTDNKENKEE